MKSRLSRVTALLMLVTIMSACTTLNTPTFEDSDGAIRGYDPVAYHLSNGPVRGDSSISHRYNGATWHFASKENRKLFIADPVKYAPQYGGYCAYAMSKGYVVSIDPNAWRIEDEKLYLNYSLGVRKKWLKDIPGYIKKADGNWDKKLQQSTFE